MEKSLDSGDIRTRTGEADAAQQPAPGEAQELSPESAQELAPSPVDLETAPLLERVFLFLEDGEWQKADEYCERVLDRQPRNALAYLGKLLASLRVRTPDGLETVKEPFGDNPAYQKAVRFGDAALAEQLQEIEAGVRQRWYEPVYRQGVMSMNTAETEKQFSAAAACFAAAPHYKDADALAAQCRGRAKTAAKDEKLVRARHLASGGKSGWREAEALLKEIPHWKDADQWLQKVQKKMRLRKWRYIVLYILTMGLIAALLIPAYGLQSIAWHLVVLALSILIQFKLTYIKHY